jgi:hypothetical protein
MGQGELQTGFSPRGKVTGVASWQMRLSFRRTVRRHSRAMAQALFQLPPLFTGVVNIRVERSVDLDHFAR